MPSIGTVAESQLQVNGCTPQLQRAWALIRIQWMLTHGTTSGYGDESGHEHRRDTCKPRYSIRTPHAAARFLSRLWLLSIPGPGRSQVGCITATPRLASGKSREGLGTAKSWHSAPRLLHNTMAQNKELPPGTGPICTGALKSGFL